MAGIDKTDDYESLVTDILLCMDEGHGLTESEIGQFIHLIEQRQDRRALAELDKIVGWDKKLDLVYTIDDKGRKWEQRNAHVIWTEWIRDRANKILAKYTT